MQLKILVPLPQRHLVIAITRQQTRQVNKLAANTTVGRLRHAVLYKLLGRLHHLVTINDYRRLGRWVRGRAGAEEEAAY